jgi:hypothetical protein
VELWELPIWDSAHKHGITDDNIRHALRHIMNVAEDPDSEDVTLFLGPDQDNQLIEVGVLDTDDGPVVIHAMPARIKRFR